jgi:ABC-type antimicrobial peptide transport system permease subunit
MFEAYLNRIETENPLILVVSKSRLIAESEAAYRAEILFGSIILGAIVLISLCSLFNIAAMTAKLRKPDFRILRALGMSRKDRRKLLLLESLLQAAIIIPLNICLYLLFGKLIRISDSTALMPLGQIAWFIVTAAVLIVLIPQLFNLPIRNLWIKNRTINSDAPDATTKQESTY